MPVMPLGSPERRWMLDTIVTAAAAYAQTVEAADWTSPCHPDAGIRLGYEWDIPSRWCCAAAGCGNSWALGGYPFGEAPALILPTDLRAEIDRIVADAEATYAKRVGK